METFDNEMLSPTVKSFFVFRSRRRSTRTFVGASRTRHKKVREARRGWKMGIGKVTNKQKTKKWIVFHWTSSAPQFVECVSVCGACFMRVAFSGMRGYFPSIQSIDSAFLSCKHCCAPHGSKSLR